MEVNVIISDKPLCLPDLTTSVESIERTAAAAGVLPNTVCVVLTKSPLKTTHEIWGRP